MRIKTKEFFYLSNFLSLLRILLIIPILIFFENNYSEFAIVLIIAAILTDYFDGFLSRKLNQVTDLGKILDPLADKLSMGIILIYLAINKDFPFSLAILLPYRDLLIVIVASIVIKKYDVIRGANKWGKLNTAFIAITGLLFLLQIKHELLTYLLFICYILIIVSSVSYYRIIQKYFNLKRVYKHIFILICVTIPIISVYKWSTPSNDNPKSSSAHNNLVRIDTSVIYDYSPIIYFTEGESFYPIEVQSFMNNSKLMKPRFLNVFDEELARGIEVKDSIKVYNDNKIYMKVDRSIFQSVSDLYENIKKYYQPKIYAYFNSYSEESTKYYVLEYWFFYWGSELANTNILWHEGDWEMIMIWFDFNLKPIKIGFSQHYYGQVYKWDQIQKDVNHPIIYIARGSHTIYPNPGDYPTYIDNGKRFQLGKDFCGEDFKWDRDDYTIEIIDNNTDWINFRGYWGIPITTKLRGPKFRNADDINLTMWRNPLEWFSKYDDSN